MASGGWGELWRTGQKMRREATLHLRMIHSKMLTSWMFCLHPPVTEAGDEPSIGRNAEAVASRGGWQWAWEAVTRTTGTTEGEMEAGWPVGQGKHSQKLGTGDLPGGGRDWRERNRQKQEEESFREKIANSNKILDRSTYKFGGLLVLSQVVLAYQKSD